MKLYATTTSERASKGQGGNDYISIKLTYKDGKEIKTFAKLYLHTIKDTKGVTERVELINEELDEVIYYKTLKGNKKKGECLNDTCHNVKCKDNNYCSKHLKKMGFLN